MTKELTWYAGIRGLARLSVEYFHAWRPVGKSFTSGKKKSSARLAAYHSGGSRVLIRR